LSFERKSDGVMDNKTGEGDKDEKKEPREEVTHLENEADKIKERRSLLKGTVQHCHYILVK